jgi:aminopeptidase N
MRDTYQEFKYQNIMTEDLVRFFNKETGRNWTPIFDQYLRRAELPALELKFDAGRVEYRWKAAEKAFDMPIRAGKPGAWQTMQPTTEWKSMPTTLTEDEFSVPLDLYYVDVIK